MSRLRLLVPEALVPLVLRVRRANEPFVAEEGARRRVRERFLRPVTFGPPARLRGAHVERRAATTSGWPVYDVVPTDSAVPCATTASVVVYVHGGGWVNEITAQHWKLIARIASETQQRVVVPIHPLLPLGTARPVRDGAVDLVRSEQDAGHPVRLAGDSSGGQIALSAALELRDEGRALPSATLLSPALDLTWTNPRIDAVQPFDPWLGRPGGAVLSEAWRGEDAVEDPVVSPLRGDLNGLGALTVLTGTRDVLNPDARVLRDKARAAGVPVTWHEAQGQVHVYALLPTLAGERGARAFVDSLRPTPVRAGGHRVVGSPG